MKVGNVTYFVEGTAAASIARSYFVAISAAGDSKLRGYGVGTVISLNSDTPQLQPGHVLVEGGDEEAVREAVLAELRAVTGNEVAREIVSLESR